jgi:raffinose/stachyose/melibiose transport system substrate-binding protein
MGSTRKGATRVLAIATAAVLAGSVSACGSSKSKGTAGADSSAKGGNFTYWSMWRADEPQAKVIRAAIDAYQTETGAKVTVEFQGRDVKKKIGPAIAANQAPDLWDQGADSIYATVAQSGGALDLTPVLSMTIPTDNVTVKDAIGTKFLDALPKDPSGSSNYVIPYEVSSAGLYYNAADPDVVAAMPTVPTNWADFIKVCDALKAKSKPCIASDGELGWENGLTLDYLLAAQGVDFSKLAADKSGATWDDPKALAAVKQLEQLVKGGYIAAGYDGTKFPAQETNWASGKGGVFYPDGSWVTSEIAKEVAPTWKTGAMLPPGATNADSMIFGFAIPKKAKNASAAEKFIAYFLQKKTLSGISTDALNITPRADIPAPAELADTQKALNANPVRLTYAGLGGDWQDKVFNPAFLDLWHGKTTAEQLVAKVKSDQVSFWKTQG